MKKTDRLGVAALCLVLAGCASTPPPQAYHPTDNSALIIQSLDVNSCQVLTPKPTERQAAERALAQAKSLPQHQTAVVILENYSEAQLGTEFRDRSMGWFLGLRGLGYRHIVFLKGSGVANPDGLPLLVQYD